MCVPDAFAELKLVYYNISLYLLMKHTTR